RKIKDVKLAYHVLFSLIEPLWFEKTGSIGPADTRVPNHSIFDHLYATASMINWTATGKNEEEGLMIAIDLAGIQSLVKSARKLSDYWAGSWLVSALAWALVREFVEEYGPDVLVVPTARSNPFYYYWIKKKLEDNGIKIKQLENICKKILPEGWPKHPVIPGTITLIIPKRGEDLREKLKKKYVDSWSEIVDDIYERLTDELNKDNLSKEKYKEKIRKLLFIVREAPPLRLRTFCLDLSEEKRKLSGIGLKEYPDTETVGRKLIYHHMFTNLIRLTPKESVSFSPGVEVDWEITESGKYEICSCCSQLPAVIRRPRGENKLEILEESGYESLTDDEKSIHFIREGEGLCPYCLIKRVIPKAIERVSKTLLGYPVKGIDLVFPSTGDMASLHAKIKLMEKSSEIKEVNEFFREVAKFPDLLRRVIGKEELAPHLLKSKYEEVSKGIEREETKDLIGFIVKNESEDIFLDTEMGIKVRKLIEEKLLKNKLVKLGIEPKRYYAIVLADGDYMGEILVGNPPAIKDLEDYYKELYHRDGENGAGEFREPSKNIEELIKELSSNIKGIKEEYEKWIRRGGKWYPEIKFIVSPSYHFTISRALMEAALQDISLANDYGGFVVYAGGDDLQMVLPVFWPEEDSYSMLLEIIRRSRRNYWALDSPFTGFHLGISVVPAMMGAGRRYGVRIAHYHDPMKGEIEMARKSEELAGKIEGKDSTILSYGRGAHPELSVIKNFYDGKEEKSVCKSHQILNGILKDIRRGKFSHSLIYDVKENKEVINEASSVNTELSRKLLEKIFKRNYYEKDDSWKDTIMELIKRTEEIKWREKGNKLEKEWPILLALYSVGIILDGVR
ncbi:type III-B CRISPR-associated protein Cas10/Cmr2, partial [Candidatus Bathyarchaeota archaeon ex4484_205]